MIKCEACGHHFQSDEDCIMDSYGNNFCDEMCKSEAGIENCSTCGWDTDNPTEYEGEIYCSRCFEDLGVENDY